MNFSISDSVTVQIGDKKEPGTVAAMTLQGGLIIKGGTEQQPFFSFCRAAECSADKHFVPVNTTFVAPGDKISDLYRRYGWV